MKRPKSTKNQFKEAPKLEGYYYSGKEARQARDKGQLLSIRIETSLMCNLKCKYCCNRSGQPLPDEISYEKLIDLIDQAHDLHAKSVIIIGGGEPTIYPKFRELVQRVYTLGMIPVIFTNTQIMTEELAQFLHNHNVSVIIKLDSLDEKTQDDMSGVKGAHKNIMQGLKNLMKAGYANASNDQKLKLGASFVVNRQNANQA